MKNKIISTLFAMVFLTLCLSLSIGTLVFGPAGAAANEKIAEFPALKTEEGINKDFFADLSGNGQLLVAISRQSEAPRGEHHSLP